MRLVRALGALTVLAALLGGVPVLLSLVGDPGYLLLVDWLAALTTAGDFRLVVALLSVVGWLAWSALALTIVFECVAVLSRQRIRLRLPGTAWLRPAVGALVLAAFAAPGIATADGAAAPPTAPVPVSAPGSAEPTAEAPAQAPVQSPAPTSRAYLAQPGDELWSVAQRELGAGERWREILALTPEMHGTLRIAPGQTLYLPMDDAPPAEASPTAAVVVVQRGDSLWRIAERTLGDGARWPEVFELNRDQIDDPDEIDIGWVLTLPVAPPSAAPPAPAGPPLSEPVDQPVPAGAQPAATPTPIPPAPMPPAPPSAVPTAPTQPAQPLRASIDEAVEVDGNDGSRFSAADLLGPIGVLLAAGLVAGIATRRRTQLLARAMGRRIVPIPGQLVHFWGALASHANSNPEPQETAPTAVPLGWDDHDAQVTVDLEAARCLTFHGPAKTDALAGVITTLASAPWAESVELVIVDDTGWAQALDDPRITSCPGAPAGLTQLVRLCSQRRIAMRSATLEQCRADADQAVAWSSVVFAFETPLTPTQLDEVSDALALGRVGVSVVATTGVPSHITGVPVEVDATSATLGRRPFTPQLVTAPARRALIELFGSVVSTGTEPAPWWRDSQDLPPNVVALPRVEAHAEELQMPEPPDSGRPTLLLLGEVELRGAAGTPPTRATAQCMEYCAWLLTHPGATPTTMVHSLFVAESTRRSNMSRLRAWLGEADDGTRYLPDAYSGRITLDQRVTSDWDTFEALLAGGVNVASSAALRQALRLIRGEPLGSLAFQWHWAHSLRADMVSMIVDAACVLADRAIEHADFDMALWAVGRGRLAAPESDLLSVREVHALALGHRHSQLERAIVDLNRALRVGGRDLEPELAKRVQAAIRLSARVEAE